MAKEKIFRSDKHDDLTLWNGSKKIQFNRNTFSTDDQGDISFLQKKMKSDPHFKIVEVKPGKEVEVVEKDVLIQAKIEREELNSKLIDAEIKAENAESKIKELEAKLAEKAKPESKPESKKQESSKKK